jgi:hypothetical protein
MGNWRGGIGKRTEGFRNYVDQNMDLVLIISDSSSLDSCEQIWIRCNGSKAFFRDNFLS